MRETRKRLTAAVRASGTTLTAIFGVGPVIAAVVIGATGDTDRFTGRDRSLPTTALRRSRCLRQSQGSPAIPARQRRLNHAVHMAAAPRSRQRHSDGRAYYDKKVAEGKTAKEALRALKRQVSDEICKHLKADAARAARAVTASGPGGQPGNDSVASAAGSHHKRRLFGQATPGPAPTLRSRPHTPARKAAPRTRKKMGRTLLAPRRRIAAAPRPGRLLAPHTGLT